MAVEFILFYFFVCIYYESTLEQYHCRIRAYVGLLQIVYFLLEYKRYFSYCKFSFSIFLFLFYWPSPSLLNVTKCIEQCAERRRSFLCDACSEFFCCCPAVQKTPVRNRSGGRGVNNAFSSCLTHSLTSIISTTVLKSPTVLTYAWTLEDHTVQNPSL